MKRITLTKQLEYEVQAHNNTKIYMSTLSKDLAVAQAENKLLKEFYSLHFKQGIPSLIKALRTATWAFTKDKGGIR